MFSPFYVNFNDTECRDEYDYLENCYPKYPERGDILWSRTQGAVYVEFCRDPECYLDNSIQPKLLINNSFFYDNDAGSLLDRNYENFSQLTASSIYIDGGRDILIFNTNFTSSQGRQASEYFPTMAGTSELTKSYYPPNYWWNSHSPIINIITEKYDSS
jgi:hypothetical protein